MEEEKNDTADYRVYSDGSGHNQMVGDEAGIFMKGPRGPLRVGLWWRFKMRLRKVGE